MHVHNAAGKKKPGGAGALVPSAGLTSQKKHACFLGVQVPCVSGSDLNQHQGEEDAGEARPPLSQVLESQEEPTFSIALALEALDPVLHAQDSWDMFSWLTGHFST